MLTADLFAPEAVPLPTQPEPESTLFFGGHSPEWLAEALAEVLGKRKTALAKIEGDAELHATMLGVIATLMNLRRDAYRNAATAAEAPVRLFGWINREPEPIRLALQLLNDYQIEIAALPVPPEVLG